MFLDACRISNASSTHSEYIILITFPRHKWLSERNSVLCSYVYCLFDIHGSVHRRWLSRNTNKMQLCNRIYYSKVYWRLSMFQAAHLSSSGALNCIWRLWFLYPRGDRLLPRLSGHWSAHSALQKTVTIWTYKPDAANTVWSSWWWAVCLLKHAQPSINFGIINSITKLHLVDISTELYCLSCCAIKKGYSLRGRICIFTCDTDERHSPRIIIHVFVTKEGKREVNSAGERNDIKSPPG
jgi:hypothetical protein